MVAIAYRPISLTSCLMKTMDKLIDRYTDDRVLKSHPLNPNQQAYQTGKSCETALHAMAGKIEHVITFKKIALMVSQDIEGAFIAFR